MPKNEHRKASDNRIRERIERAQYRELEFSAGGSVPGGSVNPSEIPSNCYSLGLDEHSALRALVARQPEGSDFAERLRSALLHDPPDCSFMSELYPHILEGPRGDDLKNIIACSQVVGVAAVDALVSIISDKTQPPAMRDSAYKVLVGLLTRCKGQSLEVGVETEELVARLLDDFATNNVHKKGVAQSALAALGANAVDQLICHVKGKDLRRGRSAAEAMGYLRSAACTAIPALEEATASHDDGLRTKATAALTKIRTSLRVRKAWCKDQ